MIFLIHNLNTTNETKKTLLLLREHLFVNKEYMTTPQTCQQTDTPRRLPGMLTGNIQICVSLG